MNEVFLKLKNSLTGKWQGEGFAQYPTIDNTKYTERLAFTPDEFKDVVHFEQKTLYRNNTEKNGQTVFWDTGFILLNDNKILMVSSQLSGRQETYELVRNTQVNFVFESIHIENDAKGTIRSQRGIYDIRRRFGLRTKHGLTRTQFPKSFVGNPATGRLIYFLAFASIKSNPPLPGTFSALEVTSNTITLLSAVLYFGHCCRPLPLGLPVLIKFTQ